MTKEELHKELQIEMDELDESEDEGAEFIPPMLEPTAKRPKLSNAVGKMQREKPKIQKPASNKRKKSVPVGEADKENVSPKQKKAKKAEKPKRKQKVYSMIYSNTCMCIYSICTYIFTSRI